MKLVTVVITLVLSVMGAKSLLGSSPASSPDNPVNFARNGVAGLCANQQAVAAASGDPTPVTVASEAGLAQMQQTNPGGVAALNQALNGNMTCPTTTPTGGG